MTIHRGDDLNTLQTVCGIALADHIPDGDLEWAWENDALVSCKRCQEVMIGRVQRRLATSPFQGVSQATGADLDQIASNLGLTRGQRGGASAFYGRDADETDDELRDRLYNVIRGGP